MVGDRSRGMTFKAKIDVLESMGSEYYAYFDVEAERVSSAELEEIARDAGAGDLSGAGRYADRRPARPGQPRQTGRGVGAVVRLGQAAPVRRRDGSQLGAPAQPRGETNAHVAADAAAAFDRNARRGCAARLPALTAPCGARATRGEAARRARRRRGRAAVQRGDGSTRIRLGTRLGREVVPLDAIVGTVDRGRDFDRRFRPTSCRVRSRWEHIAAAVRRGEALPPVDLLKIGEIYFVSDGHHRVSVARALGLKEIDAYVTEMQTASAPSARSNSPTCR